MYLNHLAITTGDSRRSYRHEVDPVVMDMLRPWIDASLEQPGELCPLPGDFADYAAMLLTSAGALVVTVFGRPQQLGQRLPLVSFGVAQRSRHAAALWDALTQPGAGTVAPGVQRPEVPYLAVHVHPTAVQALEALEWLPDFERSVAWTWITRAGHEL